MEKGVGHELQLNMDIVVHMPCESLRVNVQDAAGDRILAGELLQKQDTSWKLWMDKRNYEKYGGVHEYQTLSHEDTGRLEAQEEDVHVRHVLGEVRKNSRRKFPKGPKLRRGDVVDSCRIFGSLEGNKVQGDFHITARGHGYQDFGAHLDHGSMSPFPPFFSCLNRADGMQTAFNFSHLITELSFGPHYPSLLNPLDKTISTTEDHYYKYQYYVSIVPTVYSKGDRAVVDKYTNSPQALKAMSRDRDVVFTNQYAVTSQSHTIPENPYYVPGIFFKYNIEPIMLLVSEERGSFLGLMVRLINTASGVLVTGGWLYQLSGWLVDVVSRRRARKSEGVLNGKISHGEDE